MDVDPEACRRTAALGVADATLEVDLQDPLAAFQASLADTEGALFDVVISVTSGARTEGAAILATRQGGRALLFGMATSFQTAALSAEGAGKDIEILVGNGYVPDCVEDTFTLVREHPELRREIERRYAPTWASKGRG